jgi:FlaA1/EpsC-like NDP-sugar epimerase
MGKQPNRDIEIVFTGLRPGEKLHEELVYEGNEQPTRMKKIMVTRSHAINYNELEEKISDLIAVATVNNVARINECLHEIVPEYRPDT